MQLSGVSILWLRLVPVVAALTLAVAALARIVREEFVDQALEHDGGLRLLDAAAVLEIAVEPARAEADVLAAEQPGRLDAREAVLGNLVVLRIDTQCDDRLVLLRVVADPGNLPDAHPRHGHGGAHLEVADVVELGGHVIAELRAAELQSARRQLGREEQQRGEAQQHEQAGSDLEGSIGAHARSEEHTSELQSQSNLVCRLLLEKKNTNNAETELVF